MTWMACSQLEREPDPYVTWHLDPTRGCACLFKIEVQERRFPDDPHVTFLAELIRSGHPEAS